MVEDARSGGGCRGRGRALVSAGVVVVALVMHSAATLAAEPQPAVLVAQAFGAEPTWDGPQYPGADGKGHVFILRAHDYEIYPVSRHGELGEPEPWTMAPLSAPPVVLDAAMDRHGDWVLFDAGQVRLIRSGKEVPLPELRWVARSVTLSRGDPVAAVAPYRMGHWKRNERFTPPLLVVAGEGAWSELVPSERGEEPPREKIGAVTVEDSVRVAAGAHGDLWTANRYRYRLVHYTSAGRERLTLEVDGARVPQRSQGAVAADRAAMDEEVARLSEPERARVEVNTARDVIYDLVEGRDGRIYLLVGGSVGGRLDLDRYDPVRNVLERVATTIESRGVVSMAAGRDGLYIVPFNGRETRWRIGWDAIEAAGWAPVKGVVINDLEAPAGEDEAEP